MKIVVISDTHIPSKSKKLPPKLVEELNVCDLIIHAGDFVEESVLKELERYAPVKAVVGNVDSEKLKQNLPAKLELNLGGFKIGVVHGHNLRGHIMDKLGYVFPDADLIIFGHTHRPINKIINGQIFFNPGSPTDRRLQPFHSFGIIELNDKINSKIIKF